MKRILFALLALITVTLCACSTEPAGTATATATPSAATPASVVFDAATTEKAIIELEKKTWEVYQNKNIEAYKKYYTADFRAIYFGGLKTYEENFADVKDITIKHITFSDWKVSFPVKETAIVTYKYTSTASYKGKDTSGNFIVMTTWANVGGDWKQGSYAEAKAEPTTK